MRKKFLYRTFQIIIPVFITSSLSFGQKRIASFTIYFKPHENILELPASINLDSLTKLSPSSFFLSAMTYHAIRKVPFQVTNDTPRRLYWIINSDDVVDKITYTLIKSAPPKFKPINIVKSNGALSIISGNHNLLNYQYQTVYPPTGIDTNYKRSGFIHPLYTPHGQVLTRIQPPDHYHHYGIWNAWTHALFESDTVDFWNIKGHQGTVRFAGFTSQTNGPVFAEYTALQDHVVFKKDGSEKVALHEWQTVRVYNPSQDGNSYIIDITSKMQCASQSPLLILAYRYAGLGWRATEYWDKNNSEMLSSEGKTRDNTDNTKGRWLVVQGSLPGNDEGGIAMLSHPSNYNHPEPMRIWDKNQNGGRGDVFASFAPTKDKDWLLEPGKTYTLKYRLVVFNGKFGAEKAENAWKEFVKEVK